MLANRKKKEAEDTSSKADVASMKKDASSAGDDEDPMEAANKRANLSPVGPRAMPTRPGQQRSGAVPAPIPSGGPGRSPSGPFANNPKLNSLRETKPRNFDPAYKSSEIISDRTQDTLDRQLKKAPMENAGRMAAQQRLATKAANTANSQAIIDRMANRTRPYMTDEAGNNMKRGGAVKKMASGGSVSSASSRGDGIAQRGKTRGKMC
jgi:hypothetical protein